MLLQYELEEATSSEIFLQCGLEEATSSTMFLQCGLEEATSSTMSFFTIVEPHSYKLQNNEHPGQPNSW